MMNVSGLSAYAPYVNRITGILDTQAAVAQQSIDGLHRISASYDVSISDYGRIQSDLFNLESAARNLSGLDAFHFYSAVTTDPKIATAYAQKNSFSGTYNIEVNQLAQGETLVSAAQRNPSIVIGGSPSTITFQFVNGTSQSVVIDQSNNTLSGIAASINRADTGVSASVAFNDSAFQLVLHGPSGSSNAFNVGVVGEESVAHLLSYSNGAENNAMTQTIAARDSQGSVNGAPFTGYSNVISDVAGGLELNLSGTGHAFIKVAIDMVQIAGAVQSFVDAYNSAQSDLSVSRTGELAGDHTLPAISNQLSASLKPVQPEAGMPYGSLEQIGIALNPNGTLTFDANVFQDAFSRDPTGVAHLFTDNGNGLADQIATQLKTILQPGGNISSTIDQLLSKIQANQQMEISIENNAIKELEYSAHRYAQQLSILIVKQIVSQFMQNVSFHPNGSTAESSGTVLPGGMEIGSSNILQANHLNIPIGVSELETLMKKLATQYNPTRPAMNSGDLA